jgi:Mu transposase, C-terminal domain
MHNQTAYDTRHYVPVPARKPGALRNGAPSRDWPLPEERVRPTEFKAPNALIEPSMSNSMPRAFSTLAARVRQPSMPCRGLSRYLRHHLHHQGFVNLNARAASTGRAVDAVFVPRLPADGELLRGRADMTAGQIENWWARCAGVSSRRTTRSTCSIAASPLRRPKPITSRRSDHQAFEGERPAPIPYPFHAMTVAVPKNCLVRLDNNRYSVMASAIDPVDVHAYAGRIVIKQAGLVVGEHSRRFGRNQTAYAYVRCWRGALCPAQRRALKDWLLLALNRTRSAQAKGDR